MCKWDFIANIPSPIEESQMHYMLFGHKRSGQREECPQALHVLHGCGSFNRLKVSHTDRGPTRYEMSHQQ